MKKQLALNYLMSQAWAIDQSLLEIMGNIVSRQFTAEELGSVLDKKPAAVEGKSGKAVSRVMSVREGGVAVINVSGVISRYASMFDEICGGTSTQALATNFTAAIENPAIRAVVLNIDSQGGDASGIHELGEMIYSARGKKPIVAYVGGCGCSAAYWIASACDEVVIDDTATVGSIGVVMSLRRVKTKDDAETLEIVSSQSPEKRLDPFSDRGKEVYQQKIDELADVFIDRVARNMNVKRAKVLSDFGNGGVLMGKSAVSKGMAHKLGSFEGVISKLKNNSKGMAKSMNLTQIENGEGHAILQTSDVLATEQFISALKNERSDVLDALIEKPELALNAAGEIAKACADAGIPALSAVLLTDGVTKAHAESKIKAAKSLKDKLAAAGLISSLDAMLAHLDDPVQLVGIAIHEALAAKDESCESSRHIPSEFSAIQKPINSKDIYAARTRNSR